MKLAQEIIEDLMDLNIQFKCHYIENRINITVIKYYEDIISINNGLVQINGDEIDTFMDSKDILLQILGYETITEAIGL